MSSIRVSDAKPSVAKAVVLILILGVLGFGSRRAFCSWTVNGETIGGFPAETYGEYRDAVDEQSNGCTSVVLISVDGDVVADPDPSTLIEPVTGELLSSPIEVFERQDSP